MAFDTKESTEEFEVTMMPQEDKGVQESSRKKTLIFAIMAVIVLIIIIAVCLGVILSQDDTHDSSENSTAQTTPSPKPPIYPVILISADGFRSDYLTRGLTPNIMKLAKSGVRAKFILPQFPTKTFPNHFTTVTGLYPESHGIVFNSFYDPVLRKRFRFSRDPVFYGGEPIWVTANKSSLKSASYFWVGSDVEGIQPNYYYIYNQTVPFNDRVEQVLKWLQLPKDERPSFITLYFHEPDASGHAYGPDSSKVGEQIEVIDNTIGLLIKGLENMNISDSVNIIILSDHGMAAVNCSESIFLDQYNVSASELYISNYGSILSLDSRKKGDREKVFNKIKCRNNSFHSFYKTDLPKRFHFFKNRRIDDILVLGDPGETIYVDSSKRRRCHGRITGTHGYDYIFPDMRSIFVANGPSFLKGKEVEHFSNLEIYNLLANLLHIEPAPNNGTIGSLNRLLVPDARAVVHKSKGDGTVFRTDICKFPNDEVFNTRSKNGICASCKFSPKEVNEINMIFNIDVKKARSYQKEHLPWGVPDGGVQKDLGCLLVQQYFIIGYSIYLRIPLWTAHRITGTQLSRSNGTKDCYRSDVRLSEKETANCASYNNSDYDLGKLVPSRDMNFNTIAMLSTSTLANIAPMYPVFEKGIWTKLENMIREWAIKYKTIHVISGTIFDVDGDGLKDKEISNKRRTYNSTQNPAIPTHFYKIITRCDDTNTTAEYEIEKCSGTLRVISFILQHRNEYCQFQPYEKVILQNVARVRDIELLTGINFFSKLPAQLQVDLKTFIPVGLWS